MAANEWVKVEGGGVGTEGEAGTLVATSLQDTIPMDCPYEEVFKEITKKLYGEEEVTEEVIYDAGDAFRTDGLTVVAAAPNGLPPGAIVVQRRIHQDDKGQLGFGLFFYIEEWMLIKGYYYWVLVVGVVVVDLYRFGCFCVY